MVAGYTRCSVGAVQLRSWTVKSALSSMFLAKPDSTSSFIPVCFLNTGRNELGIVACQEVRGQPALQCEFQDRVTQRNL